ncbi:GmrSD restriction endonuclease domain-containing protein [Pedobacter helvus]|uniref:DUF262 domain-containing protein n=1 Tax=Pedobacter helvus TaxID=2563444 RepID=A0ABW9JJX7_9SPHI|nr:DUF262 domain-containing protein [Pedobacter ureilyticus]
MRTSYIDVLANRVQIPIIQRDYAQGRTDGKTNKIRKDFLDAIFEFIRQRLSNSTKELELDFIYGLNKDSNTFVPIDGQQRLTTLWLLYWFVAQKEKIGQTDKVFLKNFIYETRHSTTVFLDKLISFDAKFSNQSIKREIKNQSWYFETWDFDPGIQAMLVVLNDIELRYAEASYKTLWNIIGDKNCPFFFYKLDMEKVGLTDDLYIKMNSRGKGLTEFEYFKASFTEFLKDESRSVRFNNSIDGIWTDTIWQIVFEKKGTSDDIALETDQAFLNIFNFITNVLSFIKNVKTDKGVYYLNTEDTPELLAVIYKNQSEQDFLFEALDSICEIYKSDESFWNNTFYYGKLNFEADKTRLFFNHNEANLLNRCLFNAITLQERMLLWACIVNFMNRGDGFENKIRVVRNLAINSDSELRENTLGNSYQEVGDFITNNDLSVFESFKTDQINEEIAKHNFIKNETQQLMALNKLEDSEIFRGTISILPLDEHFQSRALKFLELFDEDEMISSFDEKCNLLLCFGDYSQEKSGLYNLLAKNKTEIREFFTTPGYNKTELNTKTKYTLLACIDYFRANPKILPADKIKLTLSEYDNKVKDWIYYFLSYPSFRWYCHFGYFGWNNNYPSWKMAKKQFNGYHWNPFLHEVLLSDSTGKVSLGNYGIYDNLTISKSRTKIEVSILEDESGFQFENGNVTLKDNQVIDFLKNEKLINSEGRLIIDQDDNGLDLEDRIVRLKAVLSTI